MTDFRPSSFGAKRPLYPSLFCLVGVALTLNSPLTTAASSNYVALVEPVALQQPEALMSEGVQALYSANQTLSKGWLSDSVSLVVTHENDALTGDLDTQNWAVGAEFSMRLPKQKEALQAVSSAYQGQLSVQEAYLNWLASGKLRQLVWAFSKAQIELDLASSALEKSLELKEQVVQQVTVGDRPKLDQLLAEKFVVEQQTLVAQKQGAFTLAQNQFTFWTKQTQLPDDITETPQQAQTLQAHPQLQWVQAAYELSNAHYSQQKTLNKSGPSFFVGAQNDKNRTEDNTYLIFEVSIPLGDEPTNQVSIAEKQQATFEEKARLMQSKQVLEMAILEANQFVSMREKERLLAQEKNRLSQETLQLAEQAYHLGESAIQSLLLIQKEALEAELSVELAQANLGEAIANANQMMGYGLKSLVNDKNLTLVEGK